MEGMTSKKDESYDDEEYKSTLLPTQQKNINAMECDINKDTPNHLICQGYKRSTWKMVFAFAGVVCSCGFLLLIFFWRPDWKLKCTATRCRMDLATYVYLQTTDGTNQVFVSKIQYMPKRLANVMNMKYSTQGQIVVTAKSQNDLFSSNEDVVMFFKHQLFKYIWDPDIQSFAELRSLEEQATIGDIHRDSTNCLDEEECKLRTKLFGKNLITVKIPTYNQLLLTEVLNPFYVFQLFAVTFWMIDEYYAYATAILVISIISATTSLIQVRRARVRLHQMVEYHNQMKVEVLRRSGDNVLREQVWSEDLVPGDVIVVPPNGVQVACDAALITGTCIINESMLTGESIPVTKTPLPSSLSETKQIYNTEKQKRHTLFCGTQVMQTKFYSGEPVKAVVVRTGYHTAKGRLIHSILFPKPVDMKLLRDSYRFVAVLFTIATCGFIYTVVLQHLAGVSAVDIAFNAIDLITISVPPALPLAMTIGIIYAQIRLKNGKIHCISPQRINISGQVDIAAFDKTGTLTEDGLDLSTVLPVNHATMSSGNYPKFMSSIDPGKIKDLDADNEVIRCMASCHTLTTIDGSIMGDPLDVKMFEATGWRLLEPEIEDKNKFDQLLMTYVGPSNELSKKSNIGKHSADSSNHCDNNSQNDVDKTCAFDLGIARQFPFSSDLQRSSVIMKSCRSSSQHFLVYLKGAPEMVARLCRPETIPEDFSETLKTYTQQGYRVIGLAHKSLKIKWLEAQKIERHKIECDLNFLGLVVMENKLKPQTAGALKKLRKANIRVLMVTGDNILTSLSVARESGLIGPNDKVLLASTTPKTPSAPPTLMWKEEDLCYRQSHADKEVSSKQDSMEKTDWHLALSGTDFKIIQEHFSEWLDVLATKGTVFSRMSPSQKTNLMEELQKVDYHVCMCGDGANDCGALKRAHTGISLSEYEASVAAPFTTHTGMGIECVPTLIREGRAALVTSFGMFKFMALYSLIQFCSVTILYNELSNLADLQYLYVDLIVIDFLAITMSRNYAYKSLHKNPPPSSLMAVEMLFSLVVQIILQLAAQLIVFFLVKEQCWYTNLPPADALNTTIGDNTTCPALNNVPDQSTVVDEDNILTYENSAIFLLSSFLYISVSIAFSRGPPFRTPLYKNRWFIGSIVVLVAFNIFLVFFAPIEMDNILMLRQIPDTNFLLIIVAIAAGHLLVSVIFEMFFIEKQSIWTRFRVAADNVLSNRTKERYKVLLSGLNNNNNLDLSHLSENGQSPIFNPLAVIGQLLYPQQNLETSNIWKSRV